MKPRIKNLFCALSIVFLSGSLLAQHAGTITGLVTDPEGNPLKGVEIVIEGLDVKWRSKLKTNKKGKFIHTGVPRQNRYRVVARMDGYRGNYLEGVMPSFDRDVRQWELVIQPGEAGKMAFELSEEERAELEAEQAEEVRRRTATVEENVNEGLSLYQQGKFEAALLHFQAAAEKDSRQASLWANIGNTQGELGRYDEGIEAFRKALELEPKDPLLHRELGNLFAAKGDPEQAQQAYEESASLGAALNPKAAAESYYNLGSSYLEKGRPLPAEEALKKAIAADPGHAEAHYQLGMALLYLNQTKDALQYLKTYLEMAPRGPNAETARALMDELGGQD